MISLDEDLRRHLGRVLRDVDGLRLGTVVDVLADAATGRAEWLVVRMPGRPRRHRAIPLALTIDVRGTLVVPVTRDGLVHGPEIRRAEALTAGQERRLRSQWFHDAHRPRGSG